MTLAVTRMHGTRSKKRSSLRRWKMASFSTTTMAAASERKWLCRMAPQSPEMALPAGRHSLSEEMNQDGVKECHVM